MPLLVSEKSANSQMGALHTFASHACAYLPVPIRGTMQECCVSLCVCLEV